MLTDSSLERMGKNRQGGEARKGLPNRTRKLGTRPWEAEGALQGQAVMVLSSLLMPSSTRRCRMNPFAGVRTCFRPGPVLRFGYICGAICAVEREVGERGRSVSDNGQWNRTYDPYDGHYSNGRQSAEYGRIGNSSREIDQSGIRPY
jgi:hypothetical protein